LASESLASRSSVFTALKARRRGDKSPLIPTCGKRCRSPVRVVARMAPLVRSSACSYSKPFRRLIPTVVLVVPSRVTFSRRSPTASTAAPRYPRKRGHRQPWTVPWAMAVDRDAPDGAQPVPCHRYSCRRQTGAKKHLRAWPPTLLHSFRWPLDVLLIGCATQRGPGLLLSIAFRALFFYHTSSHRFSPLRFVSFSVGTFALFIAR